MVNSSVDQNLVETNSNSLSIIYIKIQLSLEFLGLALVSVESTLEISLQNIDNMIIVQIYSVVISPDPFPLLFLASQFGIG